MTPLHLAFSGNRPATPHHIILARNQGYTLYDMGFNRTVTHSDIIDLEEKLGLEFTAVAVEDLTSAIMLLPYFPIGVFTYAPYSKDYSPLSFRTYSYYIHKGELFVEAEKL